MIRVALLARWAYAFGERPRLGLERMIGRQVMRGEEAFTRLSGEAREDLEGDRLVSEKGGRPGLPRAVRDLLTRS